MTRVMEMSRMGLLSALVAVAVMVVGCNQSSENGSASDTSNVTAVDHGHSDADGHDHGSWWCVEHGIPEEECSMCSSKAAAKFKEQGDWCEEHNRAESQCFICDPSRAEKFAKLYEAKFGHKPPAPKE
ncbi:MAG: hypothetical protein KatS3mg111_2238 [Pirellulaceae bacterium]|nr:MAG: hypothetical protein KatS3mg111_2238 [Pirellulaceae bacterium]